MRTLRTLVLSLAPAALAVGLALGHGQERMFPVWIPILPAWEENIQRLVGDDNADGRIDEDRAALIVELRAEREAAAREAEAALAAEQAGTPGEPSVDDVFRS